MCHKAHNVGQGLVKPETLSGMTAQEMVVYMRDHWVTDRDTDAAMNAETAYLAGTFDQCADPEHWKNPFKAIDPADPIAVEFGAIWYHGADVERGETTNGLPFVKSPGYAAW